MRSIRYLVLAWGILAQAAGAIIFSDNFDDGDVSDWTKTTNYVPGNGTTTITTDNSGSVSAPNNFRVFLFLPGGQDTLSNLFVRGSHDFTTSATVDHTLSLWAQSSLCQGCTISYEVFVDGVSLTQTSFTSGFEFRSFNLTGLTPGVHTLTLGMFTNVANNGSFNAYFDDVLISSAESVVPEPSTLALLVAGFGSLWLVRRRV